MSVSSLTGRRPAAAACPARPPRSAPARRLAVGPPGGPPGGSGQWTAARARSAPRLASARAPGEPGVRHRPDQGDVRVGPRPLGPPVRPVGPQVSDQVQDFGPPAAVPDSRWPRVRPEGSMSLPALHRGAAVRATRAHGPVAVRAAYTRSSAGGVPGTAGGGAAGPSGRDRRRGVGLRGVRRLRRAPGLSKRVTTGSPLQPGYRRRPAAW